MPTAADIIDEIGLFLEKFLLKSNRFSTQDLIAFVEERWSQADEGKYQIHDGSIIIARMIREYAKAKDFANMERWLGMSSLHANAKKNPDYVRNYYFGASCLECGNEEQALHYLSLCYAENPAYLFTCAPACAEFFNKHLEHPILLDEAVEDEGCYSDYIELGLWQAFFKQADKSLYFELGGDACAKRLTANHKRGLEYLSSHQAEILDAVLEALFQAYPQLQAEYGYSEKDKKDFMPDISCKEDFAGLLSPTTLHIHSVYHDALPYIGFAFSCSWDAEHGLGLMLHKDRVVEMGGADCSFLSWVAKKDLKKQKKQK